MSFRITALSLLAALSLSATTFAAEPEEASQTKDESATPAAQATESDEPADAAARGPADMTPEEAAAAAAKGEIEYAKEKIDPHFATAAEIAAHNATASPDDKIVCRREQLTGSHRRTKVCMTVAQRREMLEKTQAEMATAGRNSSGPLRGD